MKSLFASLFLILMFRSTSVQEVYSVEACFDSYSHGSYCFVDIEGTTYEFQDIDQTAREKYDLTDGNYQGRTFTLVYRIKTTVYENENEDGEENDEDEFQEYIIVDLELVG